MSGLLQVKMLNVKACEFATAELLNGLPNQVPVNSWYCRYDTSYFNKIQVYIILPGWANRSGAIGMLNIDLGVC